MINETLSSLSQHLASKKISSVELTELFLDRIDELNPTLNAFIGLNRQKTLKSAYAADKALSQEIHHPLTGIPIAIKDLFCHKNWRTTCCSKILKNFIAPYDAHVIEQCNLAHMVILGHTNMDEFAMGSSTEYSCYGATKNPWDLNCTPGGSSGGSAAAVCARLSPCALGSDTGGSVRQPGALCGITALKPTYGLISRYGMIAFASSLDQCGVMAKTAQDCALLLNVIAGFDKRDSTCLERTAEDYTQKLNLPLKGLRIGLPKEYFAKGLDQEVAKTIEEALEVLQKKGATLVNVSLPNTPLSIPAYYVIAPAEASANLARYDGVRFGHRSQKYQDLMGLYEKTRAEGFGREVTQRILMGTYVLSHGYYEAYYLKAQKIRRLIAQDFKKTFEVCDVIATPTTPTAAFKLAEREANPIQMYLSDIYTISINLAGLPAMSIPVGFTHQSLPVGMQLIGNYFNESGLLNIGASFQEATGWHQQMPDLLTQTG